MATNCRYKQRHAKLGIAKSYRLFNPTYTPLGVRRSTYFFLLYAPPYVHVDSLWKWCTTPHRFTYDLGVFGRATYYLGLVREVADVSETHPGRPDSCIVSQKISDSDKFCCCIKIEAYALFQHFLNNTQIIHIKLKLSRTFPENGNFKFTLGRASNTRLIMAASPYCL